MEPLRFEQRLEVDSLAVPGSLIANDSPFDWRFRQLLEALPAAVYTTDAEGRITFYNQAAVEPAGEAPDTSKPGSGAWGRLRLYRPDGAPLANDQSPMAVALR